MGKAAPSYAAFMARFWSMVAICPHGRACAVCCWEWQGSYVKGYGQYAVPKAYRHGKSKLERANRLCWQFEHGEMLPGLHVLHRCDNPACVNPAHLWLGTIGDNQKDSMRKGRRPTGDKHGLRLHPEALRRGAANKVTKLTEEQVRWLRRQRQEGWSHKRLAEAVGCSAANVQVILSGKTWTHLKEQ